MEFEEDLQQSAGVRQIIKLNVGGSKFTTSLSTLRNIPGNMLSAMFSGKFKVLSDEEGYYFIDRDGTYFRHVLNLLRSPTDFRIDLPRGEMLELEREARFYGLYDALVATYVKQSTDKAVELVYSSFSGHYYYVMRNDVGQWVGWTNFEIVPDNHTRDPNNNSDITTNDGSEVDEQNQQEDITADDANDPVSNQYNHPTGSAHTNPTRGASTTSGDHGEPTTTSSSSSLQRSCQRNANYNYVDIYDYTYIRQHSVLIQVCPQCKYGSVDVLGQDVLDEFFLAGRRHLPVQQPRTEHCMICPY